MTADAHDVVDEIVSQLRSNLTDPIESRRRDDKEWVYSDFPRMDATKPRIGVEIVDETMSELAIGTAKQYSDARIQISVLIEERYKTDIDGDGNEEKPEQIADYYKSEIRKIINDNQDTIRSNSGAMTVRPLSSVTTRPSGENVIQVNIDVNTRFISR